MAPFSIPAPCIIPLRYPVFGARRTVDTDTKIELMCETCIKHEIFFTLDGTKPQPYAGIIQGSKLHKYQSPFCLPAGKVTVKAVALNARTRSMRSNVVTRCFEVLMSESGNNKDVLSKTKKKKVFKKTAVKPVVVVETNYKEEDIVDSDKGKDLYIDEPCSSGEDFPLNADLSPLNNVDASDSSQSGMSAVLERDYSPNDAKHESELVTPIQSPVGSVSQSPSKEHKQVEVGKGDAETITEVESKVHSCSVNSESHPCCMKCNTSLQCCLACSAPNTITSKFCIQCGQKLMHKCSHCHEFNYVIAAFCQFCGKKLQASEEESEPTIKGIDCSTMAMPQRTHASVQQTPTSVNKLTQTLRERRDAKKQQKLPSHSPGKGYWHQQLDYICNHLKSYAYNNKEFRESISEPMLSDFHSAKVVKTEDSVSITLVFAPFNMNEKV